MNGGLTVLTGRFAEATLRCAARGEMPIEHALEQAMGHCPQLWDRARADLEAAQRMFATRDGVELGRAAVVITALVDAAMAAAEETRQEALQDEDGVA